MAHDPNRSTEALVDVGEVYRAHAQALRGFALYLCGNSTLADDLVADAFVRLWTARDRVAVATVRGYLFVIVRNLFFKHRQHAALQSTLDENVVDTRPGPEALLSGSSDLRLVMAALDTLPDLDRAAVLMRANDGLPYEEIAAALGISLSAAKVKVHRSRLKLAEVLGVEHDTRVKKG